MNNMFEASRTQNSAVMSVKDLNQMVKDLLTDGIGQIWLVGEISNFSMPSSGHWYFTLKDEKAQVRCAMFRGNNFKSGITPKNGQQVLVHATVTLYEARGEYQLVIDKLQLAGSGLLQQKFEQLKNQLQQEGLFDSAHKKKLPSVIKSVGIITSSTGAALHDICQILKRRDPSIDIIIYPVMVQGEGSAISIAQSIKLANIRHECDILIVGRGGGSLEDLWAFNEEVVARAIFNSQLPVISAVGHEIDITIADFVADLRAATPSAAAEMVSRDKQEQQKALKTFEQHILMAMDNFMLKKREQIQILKHKLQVQHPQVKLFQQQTRLLAQNRSLHAAIRQILVHKTQQYTTLERKLSYQSPHDKVLFYRQSLMQKQQHLVSLIKQHLTSAKHQMAIQASQLHSVSPLATLERGYSITTDHNNNAIDSLNAIKVGDEITTKLQSGTIISTVKSLNK